MKNKSKILIFIIIVIVVLGLSGIAIYKILLTDDNKAVNTVKVSNKIENWDYTLDDRDTKLMKDEFSSLKSILSASDVNYESYATSLAKLYIIDLYTIKNKINIYDIPCLEYVFPSAVENFKLNIKNTLYLYLIDNSDGKRTQKLPEVSSVNIDKISTGKFVISNTEYDGYTINISWKYKEDLGYDDSSIITIVKKDKKLYVSTQETKDSSSSN